MATRIVYESNESDTDESIPEIDINLKLNVQTYQYEPVKRQELSQNTRDDESDSESSHDSNEPADVSDEDLPSDMHWCSCETCVIMPTARECKCCHFYAAIEPRLKETEVNCITNHEGFIANCLNRWVLETSFYEYLQENGPLEENERVHKHLAYRRFVRWIWHCLGKNNRKILPSCVVNKIRTAFPSQQYCGFKYPS
ncbi:P2X purinoceptor 7-like isoform X2 [Crassostrea virginica]